MLLPEITGLDHVRAGVAYREDELRRSGRTRSTVTKRWWRRRQATTAARHAKANRDKVR